MSSIQCPSCQARFNAPTKRLPKSGAKARCSRCAHVFKVYPDDVIEEGDGEGDDKRTIRPSRKRRGRGAMGMTLGGFDGDPFALDAPDADAVKAAAQARTSKAPPAPKSGVLKARRGPRSRSLAGTSPRSRSLGGLKAIDSAPLAGASDAVEHKDPFAMADPFEQTQFPGSKGNAAGGAFGEQLDAMLSSGRATPSGSAVKARGGDLDVRGDFLGDVDEDDIEVDGLFAQGGAGGDFFGGAPSAQAAPAQPEAADSFFGSGGGPSAAPPASGGGHGGGLGGGGLGGGMDLGGGMELGGGDDAGGPGGFVMGAMDGFGGGGAFQPSDDGGIDIGIDIGGGDAPAKDPNDDSFLGDMERANQFAMVMDDGEDHFAGSYFDPNASGDSAVVKPDTPSGGTDSDRNALNLDLGGDDEPIYLVGEEPEGVASAGGLGLASAAPAAGGATKLVGGRLVHTSEKLELPPGAEGAARRAAGGGDGDFVKAAAPVTQLTVDSASSPLQTVSNVFLIVLLVLMGFFGFVASANDGLLDFKNLGAQVKAAFGQGTYAGRASTGAPSGDAAASGGSGGDKAAPKGPPVEVSKVEHTDFPNASGGTLLVVEGTVTNRSSAPVRDVIVRGRVLGEDGKERANITAPVARTLSEEELLSITDADTLKAAYDTLGKDAGALVLKTNQGARFSLVFVGLKSIKGATYKVDVEGFKSDGAKGDAKGAGKDAKAP